jgi:hypothetical protein
MDPFVTILFGGLALIVLALYLLGRLYPGSGAEQLGMRSAREISETREELEADDLGQMVAARNARRRARGETEQSVEDYEREVARAQGEQARLRQRYLDDLELDQLLAATNARRRARGLPERTRAQAREELGGGPS